MNNLKLISLLLELAIKYRKIDVLHTKPFNLIGSVEHKAGDNSTSNVNQLVHRLTSSTYQFLLGRAIIIEIKYMKQLLDKIYEHLHTQVMSPFTASTGQEALMIDLALYVAKNQNVSLLRR